MAARIRLVHFYAVEKPCNYKAALIGGQQHMHFIGISSLCW